MRLSARGGARGTSRPLGTPKSRRRGALVAGVVLCAVALTGCFGAGTYRVTTPLRSTQMPPGLWRSLGGSACTWTRYTAGSQVAGSNVRTNGPQYVQLPATDTSFSVGNCLPFWQQPGGFARPLAQPGSPFGDGDFLIGYEVAPGTYVASTPAGQTCTWSVVSGFHGMTPAGKFPDFVRGTTTKNATPTAIIRTGDFGFTSQGCGQWTLTGPPSHRAASDPAPPTVPPLPAAPGGASATASADRRRQPGLPRSVRAAGRRHHDLRWPGHLLLRLRDRVGLLRLAQRARGALDRPHHVGLGRAGPDRTTGRRRRQPDRNAMPVLAPWVEFGANWAPSVLARPANPAGKQYVMYYTAKSKDDSIYGGKQCVGIATAATPDGPFVDTSTAPVLCRTSAGGTIDASPFVASDGSVYLTYSDDVGIRVQRLTSNGLALAGGEQLLMTLRHRILVGVAPHRRPDDAQHTGDGNRAPLLRRDVRQLDVLGGRGALRHAARTVSQHLLDAGALLPGRQHARPRRPDALPASRRVVVARVPRLGHGVVGYPAGARTLRILPLTFPGGNPKIG